MQLSVRKKQYILVFTCFYVNTFLCSWQYVCMRVCVHVFVSVFMSVFIYCENWNNFFDSQFSGCGGWGQGGGRGSGFIRSGQSSWLVGCFGFNGPLRQYFSLYRAVSQREGERGEKG